MNEASAFKVSVDANVSVTARLYHARADQAAAMFVLAHGAGAGQTSRFIVEFASGLAARGLDVVTFNFPYTETRRRLPDRNDVLEATWRAVLASVSQRPERATHGLIAGGKSMGGRIASQIAAQPDWSQRIAGLIFLGYPLHPPGRPDQRRDRHLTEIRCPMLFVQGEQDAFGNAEEMQALVPTLSHAELYVVARANHSLDAPKRGEAMSHDEVFAAIQDHVAAWVRSIRAQG